MNEHRLLVLENKARADIARVFVREEDLRNTMEHKCMDVLEMAGYIRELEGRLEAVCGVVSDSVAWNDPIPALKLLEAARGT
jgi:hypothetical protein